MQIPADLNPGPQCPGGNRFVWRVRNRQPLPTRLAALHNAAAQNPAAGRGPVPQLEPAHQIRTIARGGSRGNTRGLLGKHRLDNIEDLGLLSARKLADGLEALSESTA